MFATKCFSNTEAIFNHKELKGFAGNNFASSINQLNVNLNNQFRIGKIYTGELSGYYTTRARNDLQELLYPTGQLSIGFARPILKKKATIKLSMRDIFYTQKMEGLTQFQGADEYFILYRDSRVINISFTWRFGKPLKSTKRPVAVLAMKYSGWAMVKFLYFNTQGSTNAALKKIS